MTIIIIISRFIQIIAITRLTEYRKIKATESAAAAASTQPSLSTEIKLTRDFFSIENISYNDLTTYLNNLQANPASPGGDPLNIRFRPIYEFFEIVDGKSLADILFDQSERCDRVISSHSSSKDTKEFATIVKKLVKDTFDLTRSEWRYFKNLYENNYLDPTPELTNFFSKDFDERINKNRPSLEQIQKLETELRNAQSQAVKIAGTLGFSISSLEQIQKLKTELRNAKSQAVKIAGTLGFSIISMVGFASICESIPKIELVSRIGEASGLNVFGSALDNGWLLICSTALVTVLAATIYSGAKVNCKARALAAAIKSSEPSNTKD